LAAVFKVSVVEGITVIEGVSVTITVTGAGVDIGSLTVIVSTTVEYCVQYAE
jgi:hypothetical protein